MNLNEELKKILDFPHKGFDVRVKELAYEWKEEDGLSVSGKFHYLLFRDGQPTVEHFIDFLYGRIVYFCVPHSERQKHLARYEEEKDLRHLQDLFDKARNLLIKAKEQKKTLGEPGELILFILLEAVLKAPQLACKMYLKTSEAMPVHGSDGIHVHFDPGTKFLTLYWGESKIYGELSSALEEICTSISGFTTPGEDGRAPRSRDIDILKDHMNIVDPQTKSALLEYFDPYSEKSNSLREVYACFAGFDFSFFEKLKGLDKAEIEKAFEKAYLERIKTACALFGNKIRDRNLKHLNFHFFLIPFPSVAKLRELFLHKLGTKDA